MRPELQIAIDALKRDLAEFERKAAETKAIINRLCHHAGAPAMYPASQETSAVTPQPQPKIDRLPRKSIAAGIGREREPQKRLRPSVRPFVLSVMKDGAEWTTAMLKDEAIKQDIPGIDNSTTRNVFQGTLLALFQARQVEQTGTGTWRILPQDQPRRGEVVSIKGVA